MTQEFIKKIIEASAATIAEHAEELTDLDRAIGDGDHGINMKRGFTEILNISDDISALPFGKALAKAGMTLVMKIGGASGPLFGSFLMAAAKAVDDVPSNRDEMLKLLDGGIEAVKMRGKSDVGAKTMLDVLAPVSDALRAADADYINVARKAAGEALENTRDMLATKGRASFLGERSIGHIDPGARSVVLLINAVCDVLETA